MIAIINLNLLLCIPTPSRAFLMFNISYVDSELWGRNCTSARLGLGSNPPRNKFLHLLEDWVGIMHYGSCQIKQNGFIYSSFRKNLLTFDQPFLSCSTHVKVVNSSWEKERQHWYFFFRQRNIGGVMSIHYSVQN